MGKPYAIEMLRQGRSSPEKRAIAAAEGKEIRACVDALKLEYDEIVKAHPELQRIKAELAALRKPRDEAQWRALYHRYRAYRDKGIFREIIAEGDTLAECEAKAKAKIAAREVLA
jgi:hypothetical protein